MKCGNKTRQCKASALTDVPRPDKASKRRDNLISNIIRYQGEQTLLGAESSRERKERERSWHLPNLPKMFRADLWQVCKSFRQLNDSPRWLYFMTHL